MLARRFARAALVGVVFAVLTLALPAVHAQPYPSRPIKIVVPYPPGAATDTTARAVAQKMSESIGQQVLVENRPGASGNIGSDFVAKQPPDGYTFLMATDASHGTNVHLSKNFPYDPIKDFAPITLAAGNIIVLAAHPSVPARTMSELIDHLRKNPGKLAFASSGNGSPHHLAGEMLKQLAKVDMVHVPYKGGGVAVTDLLGGQIPLMFSSLVTVAQHIKSGKVRALGVVESTRYAGLPDVPTIGETVPGFELSSWLAFFGPAGMPQPIVARLNSEIVKALNAPDVKSKLEPAGLVVIGSTPEQLAAMVKTEVEKRGRLVKSAGITAD
jgi:tripartite-type tricarboxylate transporter receptor subunit TctC